MFIGFYKKGQMAPSSARSIFEVTVDFEQLRPISVLLHVCVCPFTSLDVGTIINAFIVLAILSKC